ncbi:hypothetical protein [Abyssisolibacter fermentans]|uniref:hypothetical protein n=1 Tax=Abyssisolibacter fermentans TaxID=1766203 RepID=UPI00082BC76E|nr:hypothetical protein [Abyssisolibacter fermentans]
MVADGANGLMYLAEGGCGNALISFASVVTQSYDAAKESRKSYGPTLKQAELLDDELKLEKNNFKPVVNDNPEPLEYTRYSSNGNNDIGRNIFPENPDEFLPDVPRNTKVKSNGTVSSKIYTSDYVRIRAETHPVMEGEVYNPRHHGQH